MQPSMVAQLAGPGTRNAVRITTHCNSLQHMMFPSGDFWLLLPALTRVSAGSCYPDDLVLFDDHQVLDLFYAVYILGVLGGQVFFGVVIGFAGQGDHAILGLDFGLEPAG